jgi:hypothetical protein
MSTPTNVWKSFDAPPRRLRPETLSKLKTEIERLARSGNPGVQRFVSLMYQRYPQVQA